MANDVVVVEFTFGTVLMADVETLVDCVDNEGIDTVEEELTFSCEGTEGVVTRLVLELDCNTCTNGMVSDGFADEKSMEVFKSINSLNS
jgi:hypothetical protein